MSTGRRFPRSRLARRKALAWREKLASCTTHLPAARGPGRADVPLELTGFAGPGWRCGRWRTEECEAGLGAGEIAAGGCGAALERLGAAAGGAVPRPARRFGAGAPLRRAGIEPALAVVDAVSGSV